MPIKTSPTKTRSVIATTCLVLILATALGTLGLHVVAAMKMSANAIDDRRAILAANAALSGLSQHLAGIARDNAVSDEAYQAMSSGDAKSWIYQNWGRASADTPLYDGLVVTRADDNVIAAYWKGQLFDPANRLGHIFFEGIDHSNPGGDPVVNLLATDQGIALVGSKAIAPLSGQVGFSGGDVLSFIKILSPAVIDRMSSTHQLSGLVIVKAPNPSVLKVPLNDRDGHPLGFLAWSSEMPGTRVLEQVHPFIIAGIVVLGAFIVTIAAAGSAETRRLGQSANRSHYQATHDGLTGLFNRFGIVDLLNEQLSSGDATRRPLALHLLDLDGLKPINDACGHAIGDRLLKRVAVALMQAHPDTYAAARIGGDEFALIQLSDTSPLDFAQAVLSVFSAPFVIDGRTIEIGASIGIAAGADVRDPQELLRRADMALFRAKENARGFAVLFEDGLEVARLTAARLEADLRLALHNSEIDVAFQPLVSCETGAIRGVEALARWRKAGSSISPEVFIPVAEKSGLIDSLGRQILRKALHESRSWPELTVSVNVSPVQICNPNFAADVMSALAAEDVQPCRLTLEITEGVLMSNPEQAKRAIDMLHREGIRFALDDFGCGYASIGALRQFGFDRMKIDRSLVLAADLERNGLAVLNATISLATALNIPVTAEGIESEHQIAMLKDAGCDQLQGYLLGKPMPAEDFKIMLQHQAA